MLLGKPNNLFQPSESEIIVIEISLLLYRNYLKIMYKLISIRFLIPVTFLKYCLILILPLNNKRP